MAEKFGPEEEVPTLDCTIGGHQVVFPQSFWRQVWKDVVDKMIEKDKEEKKEEKKDG